MLRCQQEEGCGGAGEVDGGGGVGTKVYKVLVVVNIYRRFVNCIQQVLIPTALYFLPWSLSSQELHSAPKWYFLLIFQISENLSAFFRNLLIQR